jgi:1-acyl-sn-glycerol-3-phosphate acyltransferase
MRGSFALLFIFVGGVIASLLLIPLALLGGRRNRAQHAVERLWAGGVLKIIGIEVQVLGVEHLPASGCVIAANHRSNIDIFAIMGAAATPARFIAKAELIWVFFISVGMWMTGHIFVRRGRSASGGRALGAAAVALRRGAWVLLFPEGTRAPADRSLGWKSGAFRLAIDAQVPVIPTAIHHGRRLWPPGSILPRGGVMVVEFLAPVSTTGLDSKAHAQLRNQVRDQVIARIGG